MISDFRSRGFGFGFSWNNISDADLKIINDFRADKSYMDKYSAKILQTGCVLNKDMSREYNPFVVLFEYGNFKNKQGYCIYEHLVLPIKECLDFLNFLYLSFDFVFIFDRLCFHDRSR